jgi:hypothetical protein
MTQTEPRTISFIPDDVLFQYFTKEYLDVEEELTEDQWEEFLCEYQSPFASEVNYLAQGMFREYLQQL